MPRHARIKGNKRAESLASTAHKVEGKAMNSAFLNVISDGFWSEASGGELDSTSVTRLLDRTGVIRGVARSESYCEGRINLIKQHRTKIVSRRVLKDILERKYECLWTSSTFF